MTESVVYLLDITYFVYISKEWVWLQIPNIVLCCMGVMWILYLPETPKYLLAKKKWDDARLCYKKIAYLNGTDPSIFDEAIFDREAKELENPDLILMEE